MKRTGTALGASLLAALCASAAPAQDVEMSCIDALSSKLGVGMGEVEIRDTRDTPGQGSAVHARVNNAPYTCFVNDAGHVTSIERGSG